MRYLIEVHGLIPVTITPSSEPKPEPEPGIPPDIPPELDAESIVTRTAKLRELIPERTIRRVIEDCREDPDFAAFGAVDWDLVYELFGLDSASDGVPAEIGDESETPTGRKGGGNGRRH